MPETECPEVQASLTLRASASESSQNQDLWINKAAQQVTALAAQPDSLHSITRSMRQGKNHLLKTAL